MLKQKGIENSDCNDSMILVKASVDTVVKHLKEIQSTVTYESDVYGREIEVGSTRDLVIYQLKSHSWTIVYDLLSIKRNDQIEDAKHL